MRLAKLSHQEIKTSTILYFVFLCVLMGTSLVRGVPGYMDESYYLIGARNLSSGYGFQEDIIWNFMDDPEGLPHPSHLYWMPLVSILSASGISIFGSSYIAATIPIAMISAFIAPLMYLVLIAWFKDQFWAVIGALFALFGGYYLAYYSAVDSFGLTMLLGFGYFYLISKMFVISTRKLYSYGIAVGVIAGLMHLTRAEGLLWAMMIPIFFIFAGLKNYKTSTLKLSSWFLSGGSGFLTYFMIMFPWYFRNYLLFGSLTAQGSSRNLFLTTYNDLFHYPVSELTIERWLRQGVPTLFKHRIDAAGTNLLSLVGVQMLLIMLPFVVIGIWKNRHTAWVKVNLVGLALILLFFSIVFPWAGMRGSFFHSGTSFQIFLWSMAISGIQRAVQVLPLSKSVDRKKFERFFGIGFLTIIIFLSGVLFYSKVSNWSNGVDEITLIGERLSSLSVPESEVILINDPATFHWVTGRPSIVIPSGDEEVMHNIMQRYGVNIAILQINHPPELDRLYQDPEQGSEFSVIGEDGSWVILQRTKDD